VRRVEEGGVGEEGEEGRRVLYHALFVHVPPFDVVSENDQLGFVRRLMDAIGRQLSGH